MNAPSLRLRLTIWYTLALIVVLALFGADVLWGQARLGLRRIDRELDDMTSTVASVIDSNVRARVDLKAAAEDASRTVAPRGSAVVILDPHGLPLAKRWDGPDLGTVPASPERGRVAWSVETPTGTWRVHAERREFGGSTLMLRVAQSLADVRREQHEVWEAMQVAIPLALLLAGGGGFWLASVGLRPITQMAQRASEMPLTGLEDLGHTERSDELGMLARAFNALVARLRDALKTQQQFMADASHELRTPISVVRAAAEVALSRDSRSEADYRETLAIVGDQAKRLSRLVDNMLALARADAGGSELRPVDLYLNDLLTECRRAVFPLCAEHQVTMGPGDWPEIPFKGDEDLLRQLVLNVLQNAVQHTPAGGTVSIALARNNDHIDIRIVDTGSGIPPADRDRIFDRFIQLDSARRGSGSGLGLPIARWIAEAHHGTLVLESSSAGGSTFRISLPATV